ncbi:MAG: polysaccharide pyruvyl transferase family protein [Romboutsia sp.]|uniref:polysaccharide pyruvyl transferase family protein n=1 Tax=Romboutsia sp. TaxID=1965302 RepID=UPI003F3A9A67
MNKVFYIGDIEYKSLDNELRFECFKKVFYKYLDSSKYSLVYSNPDINLYDIKDYHTIVLGGGSILVDDYLDIIYNGIQSNKNIIIWGSGCDLPSKEFINVLENSNDPPYFYSYSSEEKLQELSKYCGYIGVSGPLTYKLLNKSFIDTSNILISGDPGFLLSEKKINKNNPIFNFSDREKIIAVNWGTCTNEMYGQNESHIEDILSKTCNILIDRGYKIYIYSIDKNDISSCQSLYKKINNKDSVILDTNIYYSGEILSILKKSYISINLKLHANIISSVANIPFICLGYSFKCVDFVKSIGCEELLLFTDEISSHQDFIDQINYINNNYNSIINIINNKIESYNFILEMPFKNNLF